MSSVRPLRIKRREKENVERNYKNLKPNAARRHRLAFSLEPRDPRSRPTMNYDAHHRSGSAPLSGTPLGSVRRACRRGSSVTSLSPISYVLFILDSQYSAHCCKLEFQMLSFTTSNHECRVGRRVRYVRLRTKTNRSQTERYALYSRYSTGDRRGEGTGKIGQRRQDPTSRPTCNDRTKTRRKRAPRPRGAVYDTPAEAQRATNAVYSIHAPQGDDATGSCSVRCETETFARARLFLEGLLSGSPPPSRSRFRARTPRRAARLL